MRVVLDANVIVAAFAARGLCGSVIEVCLSEHEIVLSEELLDEILESLLRKIRLPSEVVTNSLDPVFQPRIQTFRGRLSDDFLRIYQGWQEKSLGWQPGCPPRDSPLVLRDKQEAGCIHYVRCRRA